MAEVGAYLVIRSSAPDISFRAFCDQVQANFAIAGKARLHEVELFEPGSVAAHTLITPFASREEARGAFDQMPLDLIAQPAEPLVLLTGAVPPEGFDDPAIPTAANVSVPEGADPVLMLIEGSASDQDRMDAYRNVLLPMMFELGSYYTVFDLGGSVDVLSGEWDEAIFAISRWPSRDAARAFWMSDKYQQEGIPLRLDIGRFEVAVIPETET